MRNLLVLTLLCLCGCGSSSPDNPHGRPQGSKRFTAEYHFMPTSPDVYVMVDKEQGMEYIFTDKILLSTRQISAEKKESK